MLMNAEGVDGLIHCVSLIGDKSVSMCDDKIKIRKVNPDFYKMNSITWCYHCSYLLDQQEFEYEEESL